MTTSAESGSPEARGNHPAHDSEGGLEGELRREAAAHAALGGDTSANRNLTGSTTWVTLGDPRDGSPSGQPDAPDGRGARGRP